MPGSGSLSWWATKIRRARAFWRAAVRSEEREALAEWLTPAQLQLFGSMHIADQRHGLDVAAWLREHGEDDRDVLLAGLLHDAGKGRAGFAARVVVALSQAYGGWIARLGTILPGFSSQVPRLVRHAAISAELAAAAGCSPLTVELIRRQDDPPVDETARRFHLADEAN